MALDYTDTAISSSDQAYYTLPDWFLEQNVKTAQDLTRTPDQMVLCNCSYCKRSRLHANAFDAEDQLSDELATAQAEDTSGQALDEIHYKTLAELGDSICSSFIPSDNGKLSKNSTIVFLMEDPSTYTPILEPFWMRRAVIQVTKASKVSLIYLDLEILEELGSEFHHQDKQRPGEEIWSTAGWKPDMNSFTTFLEHFFAVPSGANADKKSWKRRHHSLSTVLDAAAAVRDAKMQGEDGNDAVLVHIMMDCSLANEDLERRLLERFAEMVQGRRENGQAVTILLSTKCPFYRPGKEDFRRIGATEDLTITTISDKILDLDERNRVRTGMINTQRLRRFMRLRLTSNMFPTELLAFSSDWASADRGRDYEWFGWEMWSARDIENAITLLTGRAWRQRGSRSQRSFTDILDVLEYMDLFYDAEAGTGSQTMEEASDANDSQQPQKAWPSIVSRAGQEWEQQKSERPEQRHEALDYLMSCVGLEEPKSQFMTIKSLVDTARRQAASLGQEGFGAVFMGGPGTGKSTVAELYAHFLTELNLVPDLRFEQTTGARLAAGGLAECISIIKRFEATEDNWTNDETNPHCKKTRGILFIDGAHEMILDGVDKNFRFLMDEVRRLQGKVAFLFAGPRKQMQLFMGLSPSFRSYVPFTFQFDDFTDDELHQILVRQLHSKFQGRMRVEGGVNGVFMRILARRIGRGRGTDCFANARDVQNSLSRVLLRQADRLKKIEGLKGNTDYMFLTQTDLIGPPPTAALENSTAWKNLQDMAGLASVKQSIRALTTRLQTNYDRELAEEPPLEASLNKVFLGGPGTGKTTVAKCYAEILTELGLLSNGEVIVKSCKDFTGQYYGQSEILTKAILDSARGNVLIIDEAYGFGRDEKNIYLAAAVDTIVAKVQATSTEDRAVLLLGYKDEMEEMYRRVNPGLARRFPLSSAFEFQDFSDEELSVILDQKLQAQGFTASEEAKQVAMEVLSRSRNHPNFGNAGEVDILLDKAKAAQQIRLGESKGSGSAPLLTELKEVDFDTDYDRSDRAESQIQEAFANLVGAEALVAQFQAYQRIAQNSKHMDLDPKEQIPFNFIFRGPPGTGKTTTAQKLGRMFFDMGFLATTEVEICSASELIGEYVGQTGPKTREMFQKALGKVLFIDEAYRLASGSYEGSQGGSFGKEAVDEIVNLVTSPKYKNRLVVVLAGYDQDINHLLATNPGFGSRFSEVIEFPNISPKHCQELLVRLLQDKKLGVGSLDLPSVVAKVQGCFETLSGLPDWGNARDVENLAKSIFGRIISSSVSPPCLDVAAACVYDEMTKMIEERRKRAEAALMFRGNLVEATAQVSPAAIKPSRSSKAIQYWRRTSRAKGESAKQN